MQHLDRDTAENFGAIADGYDRARPTYPAAMVAELLAGAPATVLDVGCGTAKAGRLFTGAGRQVTGVEPDPRMAEVARAHGLEVEVATFEAWPARGRRFDLLISAQAWHWVDPVLGAAKAMEVIRPGGRIALFWNEYHHDAPAAAVFDEVYARHAPTLRETSFALGAKDRVDATHDPVGRALADEGFVGVVPGERRTYPWSLESTPEEWADLVATHSDHRALGPAVLQALTADLRTALGGIGPRFTVPMRTDLLTGVRPAWGTGEHAAGRAAAVTGRPGPEATRRA